jgi:hypothetical protein
MLTRSVLDPSLEKRLFVGWIVGFAGDGEGIGLIDFSTRVCVLCPCVLLRCV